MPRLRQHDEARRAERVMGTANPADFSEALERGLLVLTAFDDAARRLTQSDVARKIGLPRATVRRSLLTLAHLGFVEAENRTYRLTPKVLTLASAYLAANPVSHVVQPACEALRATFDASCTAAVLDGSDAVMIARALPRQTIAIGLGIGFRVPAAPSALGQVLISGLDPAGRASYGIDPDLVATVAEQGYAYVAHEVETGYHSVAVPLRRWDGTPVAALNVGCRVEHLTPAAMIDEALPALRSTAATLQPQLV